MPVDPFLLTVYGSEWYEKHIKGDHMMHDIIRIDYGYRIYCISTSKCDAIFKYTKSFYEAEYMV